MSLYRMTLDLAARARELRSYLSLPAAAKAERARDLRDGLATDPGIDRAVRASLQWLGVAQDRSASDDGGVARHFSLIDGWSTSYPETTGYIVPTMFACADRFDEAEYADRGRRMLDWLVSIQQPDGGFQGGIIGASPVRSVTFNTGQILLGLAAGVERFGDAYRPAMRGAAQWLLDNQDPDGCWRKGATPFAEPGEKAYETHVAWGLFEAARQDPGRGYDDAAMRNVRWALTHQRPNGWFASNCLSDPNKPLTHTIGYVLRGVLEAHRFTGDKDLLAAARLTGDGALGVIQSDGFIPGRLDSDWRGAVDFACLTGTVQIAHCWLMLYGASGDDRYLRAAHKANSYVRRTVRLDSSPETAGAIKGSFPVSGNYGQFQYLNWAAKFFIDSNLLQSDFANVANES